MGSLFKNDSDHLIDALIAATPEAQTSQVMTPPEPEIDKVDEASLKLKEAIALISSSGKVPDLTRVDGHGTIHHEPVSITNKPVLGGKNGTKHLTASGVWRSLSHSKDALTQVAAIEAMHEAVSKIAEEFEGDEAHNRQASLYLEFEDLEGYGALRAADPHWVPDLPEINLSERRLARIDLNGARMPRASFEKSQLTLAQLQFADLNGANLSSAILIKSKLIGADLTGASAIGAQCMKAQLDGANLTGVNFSSANLKRATLDEADVSGANFTGAKITAEQLKSAKNVRKAIVDDSLREELLAMGVISEQEEQPAEGILTRVTARLREAFSALIIVRNTNASTADVDQSQSPG